MSSHDLDGFKILEKIQFHPTNSQKMSSNAELQAQLIYYDKELVCGHFLHVLNE